MEPAWRARRKAEPARVTRKGRRSYGDMANWTDEGSSMSLATFAWPGHVAYRKGKFYWSAPVRNRRTDHAS